MSPWVQRWSHLLAPGCDVLDIACGTGRHTRWFAGRGHAVTAVDRSAEALAALSDLAIGHHALLLQAEIENGPWPLMDGAAPRRYGAVVVTNYLWRPLFPTIIRSLAPGGVLLVETFARGNETVGKPSRPDFLLSNGELLDLCKSLRVVAYEDGFCEHPDRFLQRIAAVQSPSDPAVGSVAPARFAL